MRQIILDTETTGLHVDQGHRIIEIGCIELVNRKWTGKYFHQYINPGREIDEGALAIHGITNEFLLDKPAFSVIAEKFMNFITGAELIIHNAPFDVGFINSELVQLNQNWQSLHEYCRIIDSLLLARQLHVGLRNSLDALCKRYNIDNSQRELHGALLDAHLLARVYLAMTGGQATLFGEAESAEIATQQQTSTPTQQAVAKTRKLCILRASSDELIAHRAYLQQMAEKGECLWTSSA